MPSYRSVFGARGYRPLLLASTLSAWGDYVARFTVAYVVFERTGSPLATAVALAVSFLPAVFGRSLLGPLADRFPYKYVMIASHLSRAVVALLLAILVAAHAPIGVLLLVLFALEAFGGPASTGFLVLMTDLFTDRRQYARALSVNSLAEQLNQAVGFVIGGAALTLLGSAAGLVADSLTFVVSAVVVSLVVEARPVLGEPGAGVLGFLRDVRQGGRWLARQPLLIRLLLLTIIALVAIGAPEAVALPLAADPHDGGLLMAAPVAGAALGLILVSRLLPDAQNRRILILAVLMPLPLIGSYWLTSVWHIALAWFLSGVLQAFMLPLQSTFSLLVPPERRGTAFSLAGALVVCAGGLTYVGAGWLSLVLGPQGAVTACALAALFCTIAMGLRWPSQELRDAVTVAYGA